MYANILVNRTFERDQVCNTAECKQILFLISFRKGQPGNRLIHADYFIRVAYYGRGFHFFIDFIDHSICLDFEVIHFFIHIISY